LKKELSTLLLQDIYNYLDRRHFHLTITKPVGDPIPEEVVDLGEMLSDLAWFMGYFEEVQEAAWKYDELTQ
jgi:hypothetical protein